MASDNITEPSSTPLYEKEVQTYLAANLALLALPQLELIQTEYPVNFGKEQGRIDILAHDNNDSIFVIEIKRGSAGRGSVGQLQSYMGCMFSEFPGKKIKGILIAADLDNAARAALMVTEIKFIRFSTHFEFHHVQVERPVQGAPAEYRADYWEPLGGVFTDLVHHCPSCETTTKVVRVGGGTKLCGLCGKPVI
jgi:hypothetical protein